MRTATSPALSRTISDAQMAALVHDLFKDDTLDDLSTEMRSQGWSASAGPALSARRYTRQFEDLMQVAHVEREPSSLACRYEVQTLRGGIEDVTSMLWSEKPVADRMHGGSLDVAQAIQDAADASLQVALERVALSSMGASQKADIDIAERRDAFQSRGFTVHLCSRAGDGVHFHAERDQVGARGFRVHQAVTLFPAVDGTSRLSAVTSHPGLGPLPEVLPGPVLPSRERLDAVESRPTSILGALRQLDTALGAMDHQKHSAADAVCVGFLRKAAAERLAEAFKQGKFKASVTRNASGDIQVTLSGAVTAAQELASLALTGKASAVPLPVSLEQLQTTGEANPAKAAAQWVRSELSTLLGVEQAKGRAKAQDEMAR